MKPRTILLAAVLQVVTCPWAGSQDPSAAESGSAPESTAPAPADAKAPDAVVYDTWFGGGSRVEFGHDLHAGMIGLSCGECHHAEKCGSCHLEERVTVLATNSRVALHGVCFRCHEQGASLSDCEYCHVRDEQSEGYGGVERSAKLEPEEQRRRFGALADSEARDELRIVGESVPFEREAPPPPKEHLFLASRAEGVSLVRFPHEAHAADHGVACASCHHMERCAHCHLETEAPVEVVGSRAALMDNCVECHDSLDLPTSCEQCHEDPHDM